MNLSADWVEFLRNDAIEAVHWSAIGESNGPDSAVVEYAFRSHSVILTQDLDFGAILSAAKVRGPSVVQIRAGRVHPSSLGAQVLFALRELESELHMGALVTVEGKRTRLRLLPFAEH
jgi:predicted nuclease of predicted toxin-antitoxin system